MIATKKAAEAICGTLSKPSKMPGHGYGLPAAECKTGGKLQKVAGSTCEKCYAMGRNYHWPSVKGAQAKRLASITHPDWEDAITLLIERTGDSEFRWHDSGDLQSVEHLERIARVCERTPDVKHWLPTREYAIVREFLKRRQIPLNLTIRVSAHMIGKGPKRAPMGLPYSTVTRDNGQDVGSSHVCPSRKQGNVCGDCRACWNPDILHISYPVH